MSRDAAARPILITGASGFVGAWLCRHFAAKGEHVVAIHRPSSSASASARDGRWRLTEGPVAEGSVAKGSQIEHRELDLCSQDHVKALVRELQPAVILNCAAYGAYPHQTDP